MSGIPAHGVFGVPGVGKSTLVSAIVRKSEVSILHLQAGELIREAKNLKVSSEHLRTSSARVINENQSDLVSAYWRNIESSSADTAVFDGHSVIDNDSEFVVIPTEVIRQLQLTSMVFLWADPDQIQSRRENDTHRTRPERTLEEIAKHQNLALATCRSYATELGLRLSVLEDATVDELLQSVLG